MDEEDRADVKSILNEQMEYIHILIRRIHENLPENTDFVINMLALLTDIDECNMAMMEIVEGPKGKVERMI